MAKAVIQANIQTSSGAIYVAPSASIEIRDAGTGALVQLWTDRDGSISQVNPFNADANGDFKVYATPSRVNISASYGGNTKTWSDVVVVSGVEALDIQTQTATAFTTGGTSTAYTLTTSPSLPTLTTNESFRVTFHTDSGVAPTMARDGLTAKSIKQYDSTGAKVAAVVKSGQISDVQYDGTDYIVLNSLMRGAGNNLIDNSIFEYPVNQRVAASRVATAGAYNFDRWYYGNDLKFYQPIEFINLLANQVYVLNWEGTATCEYKFATVGSSSIVADAGAWTAISKKGTLTAPSDVITGSKFLWIRWSGVDATFATFDNPQLEKGSIVTTVERKTYSQRLNECMQFYEKTYNLSVAPGTISTTGQIYTPRGAYNGSDTCQVPFKKRKRVTPTVLVYSPSTGAVGYVYDNAVATDLVASLFNVGEYGVTIGFTYTGVAHQSGFHLVVNAEI